MKTLLSALILGSTALGASAFNALNSYDFNTAGNAEGWTPANTSLLVANGIASGAATTSDPQITRTGFGFPGNASSGVLIRYRGSTNGNTQIFWRRNGDTGFTAVKSVTVLYSGSGQWQTLYFNPKGNAEWDDRTITNLRFDPAGGTGSTFEIDWLRVLSWDYNNDGIPDQIQGAADTNGNGLLNLEDNDANGDGIPDGWLRFIANAPGSTHFNFNETGNFEGWTTLVGGNLNLLGVENGAMRAEVINTGTNTPMVIRRALHLQAALIDGLIIRIQSPASTNFARLYWTHDGSGAAGFSAARSILFSVPASTTPRSVYIDLRTATEWKGSMITGLRIDFPFVNGTTFSIDSIHTSDGDYDRDGIRDTDEGSTDIDGDGLANFEDLDSDGDRVSDAEEVRRGWNPNNPVESTRDTDGDGTPDAGEAIAGTDPASPADRPSLTIQPQGTGYDLTIQARPGRSYTLQRSKQLNSWDSEPVVPQVVGSPLLRWQAPADPHIPREFFRTAVTSPLEMNDPLQGGSPVVQIGATETAYLDNGTLRMGTPTTQGGSVNFLAPSGTGGTNLVNWYDPGRLIQQSYYAGPSLTRTGQIPPGWPTGVPYPWSPWPWNPIQGGDASGKKSQVIEMTQFDSGTGYFTRTVPLLWDMSTGEKAKAWIDQWNQFEPGMPNVIRVTCRLICFRDPNDVWTTVQARHQELPAVYLIRSLSKVVTYQGSSPWTNAPVEDVTSKIVPGPPWIRFGNPTDPVENAKNPPPSENWVAMVNPTTNIGVGLYSPFGRDFWWVGAVGTTAADGPTDPNTMHMAPLRTMSLDRNSILSYRYWIVYGNVDTIRQRVYELHTKYPNG